MANIIINDYPEDYLPQLPKNGLRRFINLLRRGGREAETRTDQGIGEHLHLPAADPRRIAAYRRAQFVQHPLQGLQGQQEEHEPQLPEARRGDHKETDEDQVQL